MADKKQLTGVVDSFKKSTDEGVVEKGKKFFDKLFSDDEEKVREPDEDKTSLADKITKGTQTMKDKKGNK